MSSMLTPEGLIEAITIEVKEETQRIVEVETALAQENIEKRLKNIADQIALKVMTYYECERQQERLVVTVHKTMSHK